ncbi:ABC transporter substrate-binding protein [Aquimarina pacifica]|uniref:ABC transporter substrate-binding protein n=1 Tax=Aquimarina pacifica TaxID=1296415 RepID=UPI000471B5B4|nr:helical backbone metal receptor [Aquimarina pacifica]
MMHIDQLGRELKIKDTPRRIISLVPSQTELVVALGLLDSLVGITKFCVHPERIIETKEIVGGTKKIHFEKIKSLKPDIILCNKEENTKEIVEQLQNEFPVHVSDVSSLSESVELIQLYGKLFDKKEEASTMVSKIETERLVFDRFIAPLPKRRVAYFIWRKPYMVSGSKTFIDNMLTINGFVNVFADEVRYPEISVETLKTIEDLDVIMLSSEPYPFSPKHVKEFQNICPNTKIILVDGEYFSWYGSRMLEAFTYFTKLREYIEQ